VAEVASVVLEIPTPPASVKEPVELLVDVVVLETDVIPVNDKVILLPPEPFVCNLRSPALFLNVVVLAPPSTILLTPLKNNIVSPPLPPFCNLKADTTEAPCVSVLDIVILLSPSVIEPVPQNILFPT